jgi:N-acyl-L-homoserine lactone synthetase
MALSTADQDRPHSPDRLGLRGKFVEAARNKNAPYCVYKVQGVQDLAAVDGLWNEVYAAECGWLKPADGPLYLDRFHAVSTYLVARAQGRAVGTMRLVPDSAVGLPIEQFVSIASLRENKSLTECTRLMILPEFRRRRWQAMPYGVLGALFKGCLHWSITNGMDHIIADVFTSTKTTPLRILTSIGFEETGLKFVDTELNEADKSVALILKVGELFSRSFRTDNEFYRYLMEHDDYIDVYS